MYYIIKQENDSCFLVITIHVTVLWFSRDNKWLFGNLYEVIYFSLQYTVNISHEMRLHHRDKMYILAHMKMSYGMLS